MHEFLNTEQAPEYVYMPACCQKRDCIASNEGVELSYADSQRIRH
jgi:hypothetical protein